MFHRLFRALVTVILQLEAVELWYFVTTNMAEKVVWLSVNKLYDTTTDVDQNQNILSVQTTEKESVKQLSGKICSLLSLGDIGYVLQLRNSQGSLIPLNGKLQQNTSDKPYRLDVLHENQRIKPNPRRIRVESYTSTILGQTEIMLSRISNLENSIPELEVKRAEKIKREINQLEEKLNFLQKRFTEADQVEWTGTFKKSPLW